MAHCPDEKRVASGLPLEIREISEMEIVDRPDALWLPFGRCPEDSNFYQI
jgi:hypothetical protein